MSSSRPASTRKFKFKWKYPTSTTWRGIYRWNDEENEEWKESLQAFPYHVPSFETKEEAIAFMKRFCRVGSNPEQPRYQHIFSLLTSWKQLNQHLVAKISYYDRLLAASLHRPLEHSDKNVWLKGPPKDDPDLNVEGVVEGLKERMRIPFHRMLSVPSTMNTLKYLFEHMRCGIFVKIKADQLCMFVPFANDAYKNTWSSEMEFDSNDGSMEAYYKEKESNGIRRENILSNVEEWWANGSIIDNEKVRVGTDRRFAQVWGDFFLCQLREMLEAVCMERQVADCEFFVNKRDYPHLKVNKEQGKAVEPYGFIYGKDDRDPAQDVDLARHAYKSYTPIASFYVSDRFADIPWPTTEDWETATGRVYPHTFLHKFEVDTDKLIFENEPRDLFTESNFQKFSQIKWSDKVPTAFFRGTATGGGITIETNQRILLAHLSFLWSKRGNGGANEVPYLDAALTGWNMRDKKIAGEPMTYIRKGELAFKVGRDNFVPIYEQSRYKYLIYVEGHCAACRYGILMRLGSVILKVESRCVADQMWYFPLLRPFVDHVPVKADMSDIEEKIQWCRGHEEECQKIAATAKRLYDTYCAKEGILDYLELVTNQIAERWVHMPDWWEPAPLGFHRPAAGVHDRDRCTTLCSCRRCKEDKEKADRMVEQKLRLEETKKQMAIEHKGAEAARKKAKRNDWEQGGADEEDI